MSPTIKEEGAAGACVCLQCDESFACREDLHEHSCVHSSEATQLELDAPYVCTECNGLFSQQSHLRRHFQTHLRNKVFDCLKCKARFIHEDQFIQHYETHSEVERFVCSQCDSQFSRLACLETHSLTHKGDKPFSCAECDAQFDWKSDWETHLATHAEEKKFCCGECHARFTNDFDWKHHLSVSVEEEKEYICNVCDKRYSVLMHYVRHTLRHREELQQSPESNLPPEPFSCARCSANFSNQRSLLEHLASHSEDRPYVCEQCATRFKTPAFLKQHMRTHEKKSYSCADCSAKFSSQNNLRKHFDYHRGKGCVCLECNEYFYSLLLLERHMRRSHENTPWACGICEERFTSIKYIREHAQRHAEDGTQERPYSCKSCPAKFSAQSSLSQHSRLHKTGKAHVCLECNEHFYSPLGLKRHITRHRVENTPWTCGTCNERFTSVKYIMAHAQRHAEDGTHEEKPFSCPHCPAKFTAKSNLSQHLHLHKNGKAYVCLKCNEYLVSPFALKRHATQRHDKNTPWTCETCDERFTSINYIREHAQMHAEDGTLKEKSFSCTHCPAKFSAQSNLCIHLRLHKTGKAYVCLECNEYFHSPLGLKRHVTRRHDENTPWACGTCNESFTSIEYIREHAQRHAKDRTHEGKPYSCALCPAKFFVLNSLNQHSQLHINGKAYVCLDCMEYLVSPLALKRHMKRCHDENTPWTCGVCHERFPSFKCIREHTQKHEEDGTHGEKTYSCTYCSAKFSAQSHLSKHLQLHKNGKAYICLECDEYFYSLLALKGHITKRHDENAPWTCGTCNERFTSIKYLGIHKHEDPSSDSKATHFVTYLPARNGEKPSVCSDGTMTDISEGGPETSRGGKLSADLSSWARTSDCEEPSTSNDGNVIGPESLQPPQPSCQGMNVLPHSEGTTCSSFGGSECRPNGGFTEQAADVPVNHAKSEHRKNKSLVCPECDQAFRNRTLWYMHLAKHDAQKPICCPVCKQKFSSKDEFERHSWSHLRKKESDLWHQSKKDKLCKKCHIRFADGHGLKLHILRHVGRTFVCSLCPAEFRNENNLKVHVRSHTGTTFLVCSKCDKLFMEKSSLNMHLQNFHGIDMSSVRVAS